MSRPGAAALWLLGFAIASVLLLDAGLGALGQRTALHETASLFRAEQIADSWRPMNLAHGYVSEPRAKPLYDWLFFERQIKFIYPPTSLLLIEALELVPRRWWSQVLNVLSWFSVLATIGFSWGLLERGLRERGASGTNVDRAARAMAVALLGLGAYPVVKAYSLGQAQVLVNAGMAASLWCWSADRKRTAGMLLALACAIKPQYALIGAWGLLRREWSFCTAAALTGGLVLGVSLAAYGLANHTSYLEVLLHISRLGEAYHANQSVNGLLHRWLGTMQSATWDPRVYPPYHPVVYFGSLLTSLAFVGLAAFGPVARRAGGGVLDLCVAMLATTLATPIAWEHHYGVLLPIAAALLPTLGGHRAGLVALAAAWVVASHYFEIAELASGTPLGIAQSYLFFAALAVFALLLGSSDTEGGSASGSR